LDEFGSKTLMDPPLINESSVSAANPSAYSLVEIWPFGAKLGNAGLGLQMGSLGRNLGGAKAPRIVMGRPRNR